MDIFATCCELAGIAAPAGIDGVSFLPTMFGRPQPDGPRDLYFCRAKEAGLRRQKRLKLTAGVVETCARQSVHTVGALQSGE